MSGPNGDGLYLPPHGYRRRGLVTAEVVERAGGMRATTYHVRLERWPAGRYDVAVWRDCPMSAQAVDVYEGCAGSAVMVLPAATARLADEGWLVAGRWERVGCDGWRATVTRRPGSDLPGEGRRPLLGP